MRGRECLVRDCTNQRQTEGTKEHTKYSKQDKRQTAVAGKKIRQMSNMREIWPMKTAVYEHTVYNKGPLTTSNCRIV